MANILAIGIATIDIINTTDGFPEEDQEVRAINQEIRRGGNATNTLVVLSQFSHQCQWLGTLADDQSATLIASDLRSHNIQFENCERFPNATTPTSYITLNQLNGSRTIVHYRDLPELSATAFEKIDLSAIDWIHFEGRNVKQTKKMLSRIKNSKLKIPVSIEIEKQRDGLEALYSGADIYFFSKAFASLENYDDAEHFLRQYRALIPDATLICTWGSAGAYALEDQKLFFSAAPKLDNVIDTIGAGDTFIAAFIHAAINGEPLVSRLQHACAIAAKKCTVKGFDGLI